MIDRFLVSNVWFQSALLVYVLAAGLYGTRLKSVSRGVLFVGMVLNAVWLGDRWIEAGRAPFKTLYETLIFLSWCIAVVGLLVEALHKMRVVGFFCAVGAVAALVYSLVKRDVEIVNLPPALQSAWFVPHVVVYFFSYAALFVSFVTASLYLIRPKWEHLEERTYTVICFGFTALTIGLTLGALWAKFAWGDYWTWDPKENWALITWLIYLAYLHLRYIQGWKGRRAAWFAVVGFAAVMFTYLGMHLLPSTDDSLHVYQ